MTGKYPGAYAGRLAAGCVSAAAFFILFAGAPGAEEQSGRGELSEVVKGGGSLGESLAAAREIAPLNEEEYAALRDSALGRQRRIIWNSDGADAVVRGYRQEAPEPEPQALLDIWTAHLAGTHVDSIFYCTTRGTFGMFSHRTEAGEVFDTTRGRYSDNITGGLIEKGTCPLQVHVDFAREHGMEIFLSMRMNDTHDAGNPLLIPKLKEENPDYLLGQEGEDPPHGRWSGVDYAHPEVRDLAFRYLEEVCRNFDVDGIELDFFRSRVYFRHEAGEAVGQAERDMMTGLIRRIRRMTEEVGMEEGRPILVAVRVPDSVEFSRAIGLDIERWMEEGLVDIMTVSGLWRMNPWSYSAVLGQRHGVKVYAGLSESRVGGGHHAHAGRSSDEAYRGRALGAWASGMDGIYTFNLFNTRRPIFSEMGDPDVLAGLDKVYYLSVRGARGYGCFPYIDYVNIPVVTPDTPAILSPGESMEAEMVVGDEPRQYAEIELRVWAPTISGAGDLEIRFNGQTLTGGRLSEGWLTCPVGPELWSAGANEVEIRPRSDKERSLPGGVWNVEWTADEMPQAPWDRYRFRGNASVELRDGVLRAEDPGPERGWLYFYYPWNAEHGSRNVVEAGVKVVYGRNRLSVSDGAAHERLLIYPDHIRTHYSGLRHGMDTTDGFHTYRLVTEGEDIRVYVDGELRIDGPGEFTHPAPGGRNRVMFGVGNGEGATGESLWRGVRMRMPGAGVSIHDLMLAVSF